MHAYARWVVCGALYLGCVQFAFLAAIQNPGNPDAWEKARLTDLVRGDGHRPFVYRALLPGTVRVITSLLPDAWKNDIADIAERCTPLAELFASTPAADERAPVTYLIAYALESACLLAFALTLRSAVMYFHRAHGWTADLLPLGALLGLPVLYRYIAFDYDFPQLFLFTLGFLLLARRSWRWFYPLLFLGALSKETTVLLVVVHLLANRGTLAPRVLWVHAAAQLAVIATVRAVLQFVVFTDNPGDPVEVWIARNWEMLSDPARWGFLFFHFTWVGHTALVVPTNYNVVFLLVLPLIVWRWSDKPAFLRRSIWIVPLQFALAMVVGQIDEIRVYYEVYVVLFLLVAGTLSNLSAALPCNADQSAPTSPRDDHECDTPITEQPDAM